MCNCLDGGERAGPFQYNGWPCGSRYVIPNEVSININGKNYLLRLPKNATEEEIEFFDDLCIREFNKRAYEDALYIAKFCCVKNVDRWIAPE